jgi:chemotaxis protein MotB
VAKIRSKGKESSGSKGAPGWMVTYGDMMSLLLCFFVLLFSFSTIDVVRFKEVIVELQGALGVLSGGPMVLNMGDIPQKSIVENQAISPRSQMAEVKQELEKEIKESNLQDSVEVINDERGMMIRFLDKALFDLGKADIKSEAIPILTGVGDAIQSLPNKVLVEGHTDDWPINTPQFPSNWELSTARATAVIHFLIEQSGVDPERLSAAGYSMYHPVAPNDSPDNKAKNRRVDVVILKTEEDKDAEKKEKRSSTLKDLQQPGNYEGVVMQEGKK